MLLLYLTLVKPPLKCCAPHFRHYVLKKYADQMERRLRRVEDRHLDQTSRKHGLKRKLKSTKIVLHRQNQNKRETSSKNIWKKQEYFMSTGNRVVSLRFEVNKWKFRQDMRKNLLMVQVV